MLTLKRDKNERRTGVSDVKNVINIFPDALVHDNDKGEILIQTNSTNYHCPKYVLLLAEESAKREIGLERGGLLLQYPSNSNMKVFPGQEKSQVTFCKQSY